MRLIKYIEHEKIYDQFSNLVSDKSENDVHAFMVKNTECIPIFNILNHGVFHNVVVNKFRFDDYICDFLYVTKSSGEVRLVFVEIESPTKTLLRKKPNQTGATANLNYALDQVRSWKRALEKPSVLAQVRERMGGLLWKAGSMGVALTTAFVLVVGRRPNRADQVEALRNLSRESGITIKTYDTILDELKAFRAEKRFLIKYSSKQFHIQNFDAMPSGIWNSLSIDKLKMSESDAELFKRCDCPFGEWEKGGRQQLCVRPIGYYERKFAALKGNVVQLGNYVNESDARIAHQEI